MVNYREYLPELKSMPLFQGIEEEELIALLEAMQPAVVHRETGVESTFKMGKDGFLVCLKNYLDPTITDKETKYTMPKPGEPGMMMGEIPSLSEAYLYASKKPAGPKPAPHGAPKEMKQDCLAMNAEMMVKFYSDAIYPAQAKMNRNMLGVLAQKVTDIRKANRIQVEELQKQIEAK